MRTLAVILLLFTLMFAVAPASSASSCQCDSQCLGDNACHQGDGEPPCTGMSCAMHNGLCIEAFCFAVDDAAGKIVPCAELSAAVDARIDQVFSVAAPRSGR